MLSGLWGDVRFGARTLVRAPSFTLVAVLTLGVGIGANAAVFSLVDAALLRPLPYDEPDRLVALHLDGSGRGDVSTQRLSPDDVADFRAEPGLFEVVGAWSAWQPTLTELGDPAVLTSARITAGTFAGVLRVPPFLGRSFLPEEDLPGAAGTVLLSHAFWRERLGADPSALGRPIVLDDEPYSVIGVMPEGFAPPFLPDADLWVAARLDARVCGRGCPGVDALARLAPGVSMAVARERAAALAARIARDYPQTSGGVGASVVGLQEELAGGVAGGLRMLLAAVGFVLLIACTNVASLLLARTAGRREEVIVRIAIGAGRGAILRQVLAESLLLAAAGGLLGIAIAAWGTEGLVAIAPVDMPGLDRVAVDGRVLGFAAATALWTALLFGMTPALWVSRPGALETVTRHRAGGRAAETLRAGVVVGQVAIAMVLMVGASLLLRSLQRLEATDPGFEADGVLTVTVAFPPGRYGVDPERIAFYEALLAELESIPGVRSVAATTSVPLSGADPDAEVLVEGEPAPIRHSVRVRRVTGGWFYTMGQRVLEGRELEARDAGDALPVAVVNERFAERYLGYPNSDPIGKRISLETGAPMWRAVVGIAADTRHASLRREAAPAVYVPYVQAPEGGLTVVVRADADPSDLVPGVRDAVTAVDPALAASSVVPMAERLEETLVAERFASRVLSTFALLALLLAAVGLYGVVSYRVTRRMREMGIRLTLGARAEDVRRMVVHGSLKLTAVGVGLGAVGALAVTDLLDALLYEVGVADPRVLALTLGVLAAVGVLASWLPAARAASTDPAVVLREE